MGDKTGLGLDPITPPSPSKAYTVGTKGPPGTKKGFAKKQGQIRKNWKKRYFVLEKGVLTYFEKPALQEPYGKNKKGSLMLRPGMVCRENPAQNTISIECNDDEQIREGGRNMLLEISHFGERGSWILALRDHISYSFPCDDISMADAYQSSQKFQSP